MENLNDFGFSTLSAEDYTAQKEIVKQTLETSASAQTALNQQLNAIIDMIQAIDDKVDRLSSVPNTHEGEDLVPRAKLEQMANLILPLLINLRDTAKDEFIHWPNRGPICQAQINQIEALLK